MLIGGGFGTGKSHVLEHLAHVGLSGGFVVSKVVISKETPLHDPAKVYRAAIEQAMVPGRPGSAMDEIAAGLQFDSPGYRELYRWAHQEDAPVDSRFAATLFLHEYGRATRSSQTGSCGSGPATRCQSPTSVGGSRRRGRQPPTGWRRSRSATCPASGSGSRPRLMQAAGHGGWVVLLDEAELIGRYTALQRAKSYAEIARWVRGDREDPAAPIAAVLTTVDDFETQVLVGKNDIELIPKRLRAKGTVEDELLAGQAEAGMRIIERDQVQLQPPGREELDRTYAQLKQIHSEAYRWDPPDVPGLERLASNRMRQYVRAWINEWDLRRLDPFYQPEISATGLEVDLGTDNDLEDHDEGD